MKFQKRVEPWRFPSQEPFYWSPWRIYNTHPYAFCIWVGVVICKTHHRWVLAEIRWVIVVFSRIPEAVFSFTFIKRKNNSRGHSAQQSPAVKFNQNEYYLEMVCDWGWVCVLPAHSEWDNTSLTHRSLDWMSPVVFQQHCPGGANFHTHTACIHTHTHTHT